MYELYIWRMPDPLRIYPTADEPGLENIQLQGHNDKKV